MTNKESVTLRDIMNVAERLESKFDSKFADHENRLRVVEKLVNRAIGIFAIVSVFSGAASTFIWDKVTGKTP